MTPTVRSDESAGSARGEGRVAEMLRQRAVSDPDGIAFIEGSSGRTLTWGTLDARAGSWRSAADALGRDRRIGLVISDPLRMIGAYLSALAAGITVAPLNPDGALPERLRQAEALGLAAVVTDADLPDVDLTDVDVVGVVGGAPLTGAGRLPIWVIGESGPVPVPVPTGNPVAGDGLLGSPAGSAAVILASSGTTGTPKIIPLTEAQLLHTAEALIAHHELTADDRGYCPLPLFHINALVVGVLSTVVTGSSLVVDRRFSASGFWRVIDRTGVTWLNLVPAIIAVLSDVDAPSPGVADRVAFARSASAPLPGVVRERFERHTGIGVLETYGMTEAASQIAANPRCRQDRRAGSVGRAVGLEIRVVDRAGAHVATGTVGEVEIRGGSVVTEYWAPTCPEAPGGRAAPARAATSSDGWLATGDIGRLDRDGFVYLVGRTDDVINRGGEKVFPRDVEEVLLADPDVTAAAVVGRPHPMVGHVPVAFVLARPGVDPAALSARLAERCERHLSRFRRPVAITIADSLPAGPTGKIRHSELRRELAGSPSTLP